jgi:hypothetical protein
MDWGAVWDIVGPIASAGAKIYTSDKAAKAASGAAQDSAAYQMAAAQYASDTERAIAEANLKLQADMYNSSVARMEPWRQTGLAALPKQSFYAGVPGSNYAPNLGHLDPRIAELNKLWNAYSQPSSGQAGAPGITVGAGGISAPTLEGIGEAPLPNPNSGGVDTPGIKDYILSALPELAKNPEVLQKVISGVSELWKADAAAPVVDAMATGAEAATSVPSSMSGAGMDMGAGANVYSGAGEAVNAIANPFASMTASAAFPGTAAAAEAVAMGVNPGTALALAEGTYGAGAGATGTAGAAGGLSSLSSILGPAAVVAMPLLLKNMIKRDPKGVYASYDPGASTGVFQSGGKIGQEGVSTYLDPVAQKLRDAGYENELYLSYIPNNDPNKPGYYKFADPNTYKGLEKVDYSTYQNLGEEGGPLRDAMFDQAGNRRAYERQFGGGQDDPGYYNGQKLDYSKAGSFRDPDKFVEWYINNVPKESAYTAPAPVSNGPAVESNTPGPVNGLGGFWNSDQRY